MTFFSSLRKNLVEKTLTKAELAKREEIAKAIKRENPGMPKSKVMPIATARAKTAVESVEQVNEISKATAASYLDKAVDPVHGMPRGNKEDAKKRMKGIEHAHARVTGKVPTSEETESLFEAQKIARSKPGWMLRMDPKLGKAQKDAKKMNRLMAKYGGKPGAGALVKEEDRIDELNSEQVKNVVDKSGAVHTPMSRVRHLARMALNNQIKKQAKQAAAKQKNKS